MKKVILNVALLMSMKSYAQVTFSMNDSVDYVTRRQAAWLSYERQSVIHRNDPIYIDQLDSTGVASVKEKRRIVRQPRVILYRPLYTTPMYTPVWTSPYMSSNTVIIPYRHNNCKRK